MFNKEQFRRMRGVVPEFLCSTDSTSYNITQFNATTLCIYTTKILGRNFDVSISPTTGNFWVVPMSSDGAAEEPTSSNAFYVKEDTILDIKVPYKLAIKGDSTTAKVQGIIWGNDLG